MRKSLRLLSEFIRLRSALVFEQDGERGGRVPLDFFAAIVEVSDTVFYHMCWDE